MTTDQAGTHTRRNTHTETGAPAMTTEEQLQAARREIERLKNLPPRTTKRRAGSGNPTRAEAIARKERIIHILEQELEQEKEAAE